MTDCSAYTPTPEDMKGVIELLINNGVYVQNSKAAYEQLKAYEANPFFCVLLAALFNCDDYPVQGTPAEIPWVQIKQLAGITLKNNISAAREALGEAAVKKAAQCALQTLVSTSDLRIARVAAQIVVKITAFTTFGWWSASGLGDLASILLNDLLPAGGAKTICALYALQYLMEDLPKEVGEASANIIEKVSAISIDASAPPAVRKASFRMCSSVYENCAALDWNVTERSPLQRGLVSASPFLISACCELSRRNGDGDAGFYTLILRTCLLLLDYFDEHGQMDSSILANVNENWVCQSLKLVCTENLQGSGVVELVGAAIDLIQGIVAMYNSTAGESSVAVFVDAVSGACPSLIPALVRHAHLSNDEVENILENDDYRVRDHDSAIFQTKTTKDITEDEQEASEDLAAMSLRSSALRCIDALCVMSSSSVFPHVFGLLQQLWQSSEWRDREAGIVLLGTIADGCSYELSNFVTPVAAQLVQFATNHDEHICISSIAMWSLSQIIEGVYDNNYESVPTILAACTQRMQSPSKRVQLSSVTAVSTIIRFVSSRGDYDLINNQLPAILNSINACLSVYTTRNFSVLINLLCTMLYLTNDEGIKAQLFALVVEERKRREALFTESYSQFFSGTTPNATLDLDVFSVDRALITMLASKNNDEVSLSCLQTYMNVLQDALGRGSDVDLSLLVNTACVIGGYTASVSSAKLQQWLASAAGNLVGMFVNLISNENVFVKSSGMEALSQIVKVGGAASVPAESLPQLYNLVKTQFGSEDLFQKQCAMKLFVALVTTFTTNTSAEMQAAVTVAEQSLRDDGFSDSLQTYSSMALSLTMILKIHPNVLPQFRVGVLAKLISVSDNTFEKSDATIALFNAIQASGCPITSDNIGGLCSIIYSWDDGIHNAPGTFESCQSFFYFAQQQNPQVLGAELNSLPPRTQQIIAQMYGLN